VEYSPQVSKVALTAAAVMAEMVRVVVTAEMVVEGTAMMAANDRDGNGGRDSNDGGK
jgi:hypothetical protein